MPAASKTATDESAKTTAERVVKTPTKVDRLMIAMHMVDEVAAIIKEHLGVPHVQQLQEVQIRLSLAVAQEMRNKAGL